MADNKHRTIIKAPKPKKTFIQMTFLLSLAAFLVFTVMFSIMYVLFRYALKINLSEIYKSMDINSRVPVIILFISSFIVGYALSLLYTHAIISPIHKVIKSMDELAKGNYKERLDFGKQANWFEDVSDFTNSFNQMASELEHTDTLNNDFINNFSHEFKTPIVSIAGFAKLLKKGNLPPETQIEYLNIIEQESLRLSDLALSVLNLIKIENQTVLTNVTKFNLSEQLRNSILLFEDKWENKKINLQLDFDEFYIRANEELLKQVWINLLDNAIKYSPINETVSVSIKRKEHSTIVSIANTGSEISPYSQKHIFNKFYQADESHSTKGSGIGLAVVKKIVSLHRGEVSVISGNKKTIFAVTIPDIL